MMCQRCRIHISAHLTSSCQWIAQFTLSRYHEIETVRLLMWPLIRGKCIQALYSKRQCPHQIRRPLQFHWSQFPNSCAHCRNILFLKSVVEMQRSNMRNSDFLDIIKFSRAIMHNIAQASWNHIEISFYLSITNSQASLSTTPRHYIRMRICDNKLTCTTRFAMLWVEYKCELRMASMEFNYFSN